MLALKRPAGILAVASSTLNYLLFFNLKNLDSFKIKTVFTLKSPHLHISHIIEPQERMISAQIIVESTKELIVQIDLKSFPYRLLIAIQIKQHGQFDSVYIFE